MRRAATAQAGKRIGLGRLLDDRAVKFEQQRAVPDRGLARPRRQRTEQQAKEQQHRDQNETVLDPDENLPRAPYEFHLAAPYLAEIPPLARARRPSSKCVLHDQHAYFCRPIPMATG
ncbi:hypothetical protein D9M73_137980 [compost metagenome]